MYCCISCGVSAVSPCLLATNVASACANDEELCRFCSLKMTPVWLSTCKALFVCLLLLLYALRLDRKRALSRIGLLGGASLCWHDHIDILQPPNLQSSKPRWTSHMGHLSQDAPGIVTGSRSRPLCLSSWKWTSRRMLLTTMRRRKKRR